MDEELPSQNVIINMISGAMAGILENTLFFPLDTTKTRMQDLSDVHSKRPKGVSGTLFQMMKEEGILSPYKGFGVTVIGSAPAHAGYFASYEMAKELLLSYSDNATIYGISGAVATLFHDGIMIPTETVKQRLQMENSPYKSFIDCAKKVYKAEGIRAFYRSYGTQLLMNIPFQSAQFTTYEVTSDFLNPGRPYNLVVHLISGAIAGGLAAAVTTPFDVCKTLLNTQTQKEKVIGVKNAIITVYKVAGPFGYFRGITARVLFVMPSTAVCWGVYETTKFILRKLDWL